MSNTVEFVIRMRDMMSGGLGKLTSVSQSSFSRMSQHQSQHQNRNSVLKMSYDELTRAMRNAEATIKSSTIPSQISAARRELEQLQRAAHKHPGRGMTPPGSRGGSGIGIGGVAVGSMLGGVVGGAITSGLSMLAGGVGDVFQKSMQKEQAIVGLSTFLGKDGAMDAYRNIQKDAEITPFDTDSLLQVNRSLISAGLGADAARRDTMNLANAISAVGGGNAELARMAANMQQIKTVGKATAMDIRQFGMVGINIYEMLAKATGKTVDQVKDMDVSYDTLAKALEMARANGGMYAGALEAQGNTRGGKWNTIKDKFSTAAVDVLDAFAPLIDKGLDFGIRIAEGVQPMLEMAKPYIDMISTGLGRVFDYISNITSGSGEWSGWFGVMQDHLTTIWTTIGAIAIKLWDFVKPIIAFIRDSEMLKDFVRLGGWIFEKIGWVIGKIIDVLKWAWDNVLGPILRGMELVYRWVKGGTTTAQGTTTVKTVKPAPTTTMAATPSTFAQGKALSEGNAASGAAAAETVSSGGPKVINITVHKFFDNFQVTTMNNGETADSLERIVMEALSRVIYNGGKLAAS